MIFYYAPNQMLHWLLTVYVDITIAARNWTFRKRTNETPKTSNPSLLNTLHSYSQ